MKAKSYSEAKNVREMGKLLKLPASAISRIEMRSQLVRGIKRIMARHKLSEMQAAKQAEVSRIGITAIVNGNLGSISTERLLDIAYNLGLKVQLKVA